MSTYNIIGDVAGRFDELILLLAKMPKADKTILVGDIIDRGPKSKEVVEWAMSNPDVIVIKGNHEDMMIDFYRAYNLYGQNIWQENGGDATIKSYGCLLYSEKASFFDKIREYLNKDHMDWMEKLPIFFKDEGLFVSHAPWNGSFDLGHFKSEVDMLWNRFKPKQYDDVFQIFGHNSSLRQFGNHAICIDNCSNKLLTGIHWPTKQLFEQEYLNEVG